MKPHEKELLRALGERVRLSDLENIFYEDLASIREQIYSELVRQGYWHRSPEQTRLMWSVVAVIVLICAVGVVAISLESWPFVLAGLLSAMIVGWFGRYMPRKTQQGTRALEKILGLQEFLRRTDEDRLSRESDQASLFERMLPYALALGVAHQWAKAFEGIYQVQPAWYSGPYGLSFTPWDFTRRIERASSRMATVMSSTPRSSGGSGFGGGGFSGGGGGGGGGGSW